VRARINGASLWLRLYEIPPIGWHVSRVNAGLESEITTTLLSIGSPPIKIATISVHATSGEPPWGNVSCAVLEERSIRKTVTLHGRQIQGPAWNPNSRERDQLPS
jgi:hypothetical protein